MDESVVLFAFNSPLLLIEVERDPFGRIKQGWVVNGGWLYKRLGNTVGAFDSEGRCVNQFHQEADDEQEVIVPTDKRGDYDAIISWAETVLKERNTGK